MTRDELLAEIQSTEEAIKTADGFDQMMLEHKLESLKKSVGFSSSDLQSDSPESFFAQQMADLG